MTKKRLIPCIPGALNESNCSDIDYLNCKDKWETFLGHLGTKFKRVTKTIKWTNKFQVVGQQKACDIVSTGDNQVTFCSLAKIIHSSEDAFDLSFDNEMFNLLVTKTNAKTENKLQFPHHHKHHMLENLNCPYLIKSSLIEMHVRLCIMYFRGLY